MNHPMSEDPRNDLYKLYARFLKRYQPRMFVFENVMGISSANEGATFKNLKKYLRRVGYEIEWREQNSKDFGVLQSRRRMIIVGWLKNSGLAYPEFVKKETEFTVNDLLADLPKLKPGLGSTKYRTKTWSRCVEEMGIRTPDDVLTLHTSRPNKERDIEIYKRAIELWNDGHKRLNYNDLPEELKTHKNRHSFVDRFKVVEGDATCCHTVLAHLSKDGHYFIHPDIEQHRSITVREAARIHVCSNLKCGRLFDVRDNFDLDRYLRFGVNCPDCHKPAYPSRFITICENGHMDDFPWNWWVHRGNTNCKGKLKMYSTGNSLNLIRKH